jgi:hypothetical protein
MLGRVFEMETTQYVIVSQEGMEPFATATTKAEAQKQQPGKNVRF